jgi:hypothetical protein
MSSPRCQCWHPSQHAQKMATWKQHTESLLTWMTSMTLAWSLTQRTPQLT